MTDNKFNLEIVFATDAAGASITNNRIKINVKHNCIEIDSRDKLPHKDYTVQTVSKLEQVLQNALQKFDKQAAEESPITRPRVQVRGDVEMLQKLGVNLTLDY